jgi:uncharacterized protein YkwD
MTISVQRPAHRPPRTTPRQDRGRPLALATIALTLLAGAAPVQAADRPPHVKTILSPIDPGPNPLTATGPSLDRPTPPPPLARPSSILSVTVQDDTTLNQPLLGAINAFRRAHHLRPLTPSRQLARAARAHVQALAYAGAFAHEWPDGRRFDRWIRRYYPIGTSRAWSVGENLLWSSGPSGSLGARQALAIWIASPPHHHILLTPSWKQLGIGAVAARQAEGVYGGQDVLIIATDFGTRT